MAFEVGEVVESPGVVDLDHVAVSCGEEVAAGREATLGVFWGKQKFCGKFSFFLVVKTGGGRKKKITIFFFQNSPPYTP